MCTVNGQCHEAPFIPTPRTNHSASNYAQHVNPLLHATPHRRVKKGHPDADGAARMILSAGFDFFSTEKFTRI